MWLFSKKNSTIQAGRQTWLLGHHLLTFALAAAWNCVSSPQSPEPSTLTWHMLQGLTRWRSSLFHNFMTRKFSSLFSEVFRSAISFPLASKFGKYFKRETGHVIETNILKGKLISDQVNNWVTLTSHNHQNFCWFLYPQAMNDPLPGVNPDSQPLAYS